MKKLLLMVAIPLLSYIGNAQVGINNTDPKASLDISASNATNPSNTDGMLIPRIEDFPGVNPGTDQQGMMVYLTTTSGSNTPGFYYWDNNAGPAAWVSVKSEDHDWYQENTTSPPSTNGADIFTDGNVGIGISNVNYPLQIETSSGNRTVSLLNENTGASVYGFYNRINESSTSSGSTNGIVNSITRTNQGSISGVANSFSNSEATLSFGYLFGYQNSFGTSTSTSSYGLINRFQGTTGTAYGISNLIGHDITNFYGIDNHNISGANLTGTFYGVYNSLTGSDSGTRYGMYTNFEETGSGDKYGDYINIASTAGGTHYGVYSDVRKSNSYSGYFLGRTSFGTGTSNRYLMPNTDGTNGQVMTTDGSGNLTFSTLTAGSGTLDEAYDYGGAGAGRNIIADNGPVNIQSTDGLRVEGNILAANNIVHDGDANTFLSFLPDQFQIDAGGRNYMDINHSNTSVIFNEDSTQSDFRVESDNQQYMLFVDGSNNAIGIGQNNPLSPLHVGISTTFDLGFVNTGQDGLFLRGTGNNSGLNTVGSSIGFGPPHTARAGQRKAAISSVQTSGDEDHLGLAFYVHSSVVNQTNMVEGMRLTHQRYLGINNNSPSATLDVIGSMQYEDGNESAGFVLASDALGNATWTDPSGLVSDTQNTLDEAYDEGGAGAGSTITADNGAVTVQGQDGFIVTGTYGVGNTIGLSGAGTRMFFNPRKAAFRAGLVGNGGIWDPTAWNDVNVGNQSFAVNAGTIASSSYSFASGLASESSGYASTAMGEATIATGNGEMAVGSYNKTGIARVFVVGNGISDASRSNAFEVFDSGLITFNEEYTFPLTDGIANQILQTNGAGTLSWVTATSGDILSVTAGSGLLGGGTSGAVTLNANANNGMNVDVGADAIQWGGALIENTTITQANFSATFNLTGTGDFRVQDNSITSFIVEDSGDVGFGLANPSYQVDIYENDNTKLRAVNISKTDNTTSTSYGIYNSKSSSGSSIDYGQLNRVEGTGTGTQYGLYNDILTTGAGTKSGVYNNFATGTTSVKYGVYNNFLSTSGNYYGMNNNMSGSSNSAAFGVSNTLSGSGTGAKTGFNNTFSGSNGNANIYVGLDNTFNDSGNGDRFGVRNIINSSGSGTHYGTYNEVAASSGWAGYFLGRNYISERLSIGETNNANASLNINANSSGTVSHIELEETTANDGARIRFTNASETNNEWILYARADNTAGSGAFNIYSSEITSNVIRVESDGKVGIMRNPTTNQLEVGGTASKAAAGSWLGNSDSRLKKNILTIEGESALEKITKLRGVTYEWDDSQTGMERPEGIQYGFIAQELMTVFPEKVSKDNQGFYQTAYGDYDAIFVQAIKELNTKVEDLETENKQLKTMLSKYEALEARLDALEENTNATSDVANNK